MSTKAAQQLFAQGEFRKAAEWLDASSALTIFERVIRAWCEYELGDASKAYSQANALLSQSRDWICQAYCYAIAGLAVGRQGSPEQGVPLFRRALNIAAEHDCQVEASLLGRYTNNVLSWIGFEPVLPELPRLRELSLKSGNARALASYHIAYARVAALQAQPTFALKELATANNLLLEFPDAYLSWLSREAQASIALMDSNISEARRCAEQCLDLSRKSGAKNRITYALGNLANIAAMSGDFANARRLLQQSLDALDPFSQAKFPIWCTGISIGLATGDDILADSMVKSGELAIERIGPNPTYYRLWFDLHRVRWLIAQGLFAKAAEMAREAQEQSRFVDKELRDRLRLLSAEAEFKRGKPQNAAHQFGALCADISRPSLEVLAEVLRVCALLSDQTHTSTQHTYLAVAARLLASADLRGIQFELSRVAGLSPASDTESGQDASAILRLAVIVQLGRHPAVLGREVVSLLRQERVGCEILLIEEVDGRATVIDRVPQMLEHPSRSPVPTSRTLGLGENNRSKYRLEAHGELSASDHLIWAFLRHIIEATKALHRLDEPTSIDRIWSTRPSAPDRGGMVIVCDKSVELLNTTHKLAPSNITVLITGETGTGKELLARALHDASPRSAKPFIPFNCNAVSRDMLDAQLFGYRKGAFTGANEAFAGVIRAAAGGTLFLDEIGEITLDVQPKLLRFLESGEIHPLGEPRPTHVDVRVVAATNADLEKLVAEGRFREDLFYRLNVVRLQVPPLRDRREEIPPLVQHFLDRSSREAHKTGIRIAEETMEYLILYQWPGNVRQLANEVRRMVALAESGAVLMPEHLSTSIASSRRTVPAAERPIAPTEFVVRVDQPMSAAMEHLERSMIQYALRLSGGRVEDAAHRLGLSRKGLYLKRQRLHIESTADERAMASQ